MSDWDIGYWSGSQYDNVDYDYVNVLGTPLSSMGIEVLTESSGYFSTPLVAGIYTITFIDSTHITITSADGFDNKNPYMSETSVLVSSSAWNYNIIPGMRIRFYSPVAGNVGRIGIGCVYAGSTWTRVYPFGPIVAGQSSDPIRLQLSNVTLFNQMNCKLYASNSIRLENATTYTRPFLWFKQMGPTNPTPDSDLLGAEITFDNFTEGPHYPTVDLLVDGAAISIYDVKNDQTYADGTGLPIESDNEFQFSDGTKYQSGRFHINPDMEETDTATIYVSDGGSFAYLSTDGNTYVSGATGIDLTESGQATGVVRSGHSAVGYVKFTIPLNSTADLNMRLANVRVEGEAY